MLHRRSLPLAAALVCLSSFRPTAARGEEPSRHRVWIESHASELEFSVTDGNGTELGRCRGGCVMELPSGHFELDVPGGDRFVSTRRRFEVEGPTAVDISPGRSAPHVVGVVAASVGAVACVTGLGLRMIAGFAETPTLADERRVESRARIGGIMAIAGAVTFAIGLPLALLTRSTVTSEALASESASSVRVALAPTPGGGVGLGLAVVF